MLRKEKDGFQWLEFEILAEEKGVAHGVILRHGEMRFGADALLNTSGLLADNHCRMFQTLNIANFVCGRQVHGDAVVLVEDRFTPLGECDALITRQHELALMAKHADCQAAIFYDPIHRALATVHSGWRGNVKNIYHATISRMRLEFGSKPEELLVGISPSLGPEHAEFKHYKEEFPEEFWDYQVRPNYFDLWAIARYQLEKCGILPHHIEIAGICTYANPQDCFSYRRDKVKSGHVTFAMLRD